MSSPDSVALHGWTAVPRDGKAILEGKPYLHKPTSLLVKDIPFPSDPTTSHVRAYAQERLSPQTFNHSMRVYYFSMAILRQQFPSHAATLSPSTLAITSLLHDIGTTPSNLRSTQLSFEFHGGITALNLLQSDPLNAPQSQAEAVAEAIIRHQDIGTVGTITFLGQLIQLATLYDNTGGNPDIVHKDTRDDVNREFPRTGWSRCFAEVIKEEMGLKPWAHTSHLGKKDFESAVLGNELMREYE